MLRFSDISAFSLSDGSRYLSKLPGASAVGRAFSAVGNWMFKLLPASVQNSWTRSMYYNI
jgi:hypothetical protein